MNAFTVLLQPWQFQKVLPPKTSYSLFLIYHVGPTASESAGDTANDIFFFPFQSSFDTWMQFDTQAISHLSKKNGGTLIDVGIQTFAARKKNSQSVTLQIWGSRARFHPICAHCFSFHFSSSLLFFPTHLIEISAAL